MSIQYLSSIPLPQANAHRRTLSSIALSAGNSRNSSLWAEDYCDADPELGIGGSPGGFETQAAITPPPAAATTSRPFPRSIPISPEEESCPRLQARTHQRSLTALLPFKVAKTRGNSKSPERSTAQKQTEVKDDDEFMATLTGDREGIIKVEDKNRGGLSSWFTGSSAPVAVGIPVTEPEPLSLPSMSTSNSVETSPEGAKLRKRPTLQSLDSTNTTLSKNTTSSNSRFSFFSSPKFSPQPTTIQLPTSTLASDPLLTLDITTALFPNGAPAPDAPFSPSAYKNLLMNAEGTLSKLQSAYKLRTLALHEISAEYSAQADELEEAETRATCLKSQLEDMARRVAEQDRAMEELVFELAKEKHARAEEKEARERSIAVIQENRERLEREGKRASCCSGTHGEDDLGISLGRSGTGKGRGKREWRRSNDSSVGEFSESDNESSDSIFSRSLSPTYTGSETASTMTLESTPEILQASFGRVVTLQAQGQTIVGQRPKSTQQPSTFQKILAGVSPTPQPAVVVGEDAAMSGLGLEDGCKNCMGKDSSVAWDAVGLLRAENRGLKDRVGELEGAVEGALDMCAGLRL